MLSSFFPLFYFFFLIFSQGFKLELFNTKEEATRVLGSFGPRIEFWINTMALVKKHKSKIKNKNKSKRGIEV